MSSSHRRAASAFANERSQSRGERRQGFRRRQRALEQGVLHDPARHRIDFDRDNVDRARRRMRFEIEQQQCPQHLRIAQGGRQLQHPRVNGPIDESQIEPQRGGATIGALERGRQRIEQPRKHERQRLERIDRPLELHRLNEPRHTGIRHERRTIDTTSELLEHQPLLPHPLGQIDRWQRRDLSKHRQAPPPERLEMDGGCLDARGGGSAPRVLVFHEGAQAVDRERRQSRPRHRRASPSAPAVHWREAAPPSANARRRCAGCRNARPRREPVRRRSRAHRPAAAPAHSRPALRSMRRGTRCAGKNHAR